jgi:hypothetical protein
MQQGLAARYQIHDDIPVLPLFSNKRSERVQMCRSILGRPSTTQKKNSLTISSS